jgi:hypothetical protein
MATEKIVLETEVELGNSTNSVKSLKAELRQVTNELANLEEGSAAFVRAAQKAGELQDKIGDVKNTVKAFNPEAKFQALAGAVGIAANGFSAMQGAMALFGSESKELNKVIAQTQGAIALATGLNGLLGMGDAFKLLKLTAISSFNSIKLAIGATGIGLIVVAVGLLVANWESLSKAVKESFPIFNNIGAIFDKLREIAYGTGEVIKNAILMPFKTIGKAIQGDFAGALEEIKNGYNIIGNFEKGAEKGREANRQAAADERLKNLIKEKEDELEVHRARGKDTYKEELALNKLKQQAAKDNKEELKKLQQEEKVLNAGHQKDLANKAKEDQKKREDEAKRKKEFEEKLIEEQKKQQEELIARKEKEYQDTNKLTDDFYKKKKLELIKSGATEEEIKKGQQQIEIKDLEQKIQNAKDYGQNTVDLELQLEQKKIDVKKDAAKKQEDILKEAAKNEKLSAEERYAALDALNKAGVISDKEASDAKIAIAKAEKDAKFAELDAYAGVLNQASDLLGKNTVEGKAMAIAAATISTYTAIAKTLAAHGANPIPGYAIAQAIVTGIAGFAAVKNIIDTPIPNQGGGGGGGTPSMPSMPAAPAMRPTGFSTGQPSQTPPKVEPQKVYVVESDITNSQNKVARIQSKATIQ